MDGAVDWAADEGWGEFLVADGAEGRGGGIFTVVGAVDRAAADDSRRTTDVGARETSAPG